MGCSPSSQAGTAGKAGDAPGIAPAQAPLCRVYIPHTSRQDNGDGAVYTAYSVSVHCAGKNWTVEKRFRNFAELHSTLTRRFPEVAFPAFPNKTFLSPSLENGFVESRRAQLELFLQLLLQVPTDPAQLQAFHQVTLQMLGAFLEVPEHVSRDADSRDSLPAGDAQRAAAGPSQTVQQAKLDSTRALIAMVGGGERPLPDAPDADVSSAALRIGGVDIVPAADPAGRGAAALRWLYSDAEMNSAIRRAERLVVLLVTGGQPVGDAVVSAFAVMAQRLRPLHADLEFVAVDRGRLSVHGIGALPTVQMYMRGRLMAELASSSAQQLCSVVDRYADAPPDVLAAS